MGVRKTAKRSRRNILIVVFGSLLASPVAAWQLVSHRNGGSSGCTSRVGSTSLSLTTEQAINATTIALTARRLGLPNRAVTIGIATAFPESNLKNLSYGDRDSVGLFQQRPSQGWGTTAQLQQPKYAATAFYNALAKVPGWRTQPVGTVAQAVQRSGYPARYGQWESKARIHAIALSGENAAAFTCRVRRVTKKPFSQMTSALSSELGGKTLDVPVDAQRGWAIASWVVARAQMYGVTSIDFGNQRWSAATGTWRPHSPSSASVRVLHR